MQCPSTTTNNRYMHFANTRLSPSGDKERTGVVRHDGLPLLNTSYGDKHHSMDHLSQGETHGRRERSRASVIKDGVLVATQEYAAFGGARLTSNRRSLPTTSSLRAKLSVKTEQDSIESFLKKNEAMRKKIPRLNSYGTLQLKEPTLAEDDSGDDDGGNSVPIRKEVMSHIPRSLKLAWIDLGPSDRSILTQ